MTALVKRNSTEFVLLVGQLLSGEPRLLLIGIVLVGLAIRAGYAPLAVELDPVLRINPLHGDAYGYHLLATNLAEGNGFTWNGVTATSYRMPGYPAYLALIYSVAGENHLLVRLSHALFGALLCLPVYAISRKSLGDRPALLAALGVALHPMLIYMTGWIYAETIFIFLLWVALWLLWWNSERASVGVAVLAGLVLGLAVYFRPEVLILPAAVLALAVVRRWSVRQLGLILLVQIVVLLTVLPWSLRNQALHGHFVLLTTSAGSNLYAGNNPDARGGSTWVFPLEDMTELASDEELGQRAKTWARENPADFVKALPLKLFKFFAPIAMETSDANPLARIMLPINVLYNLFLLAAGLGMWKARQSALGIVLISVVGLYVLTALAFYGGTRVALPIAPALITMALLTLQALWARQRVGLRGRLRG